MKANGAPERLYLLPNGLISYCRTTDEDVEYIRTDVIIEKACEWLRKELCNYFDATREDYEICIEDFKKAMKGE